MTFGHTDAQRTGMLKQNEAKGWKDSRYGSNKNSPRLIIFKAWSSVNGIVWEGFGLVDGGVSLREDFEDSKAYSRPSVTVGASAPCCLLSAMKITG